MVQTPDTERLPKAEWLRIKARAEAGDQAAADELKRRNAARWSNRPQGKGGY